MPVVALMPESVSELTAGQLLESGEEREEKKTARRKKELSIWQ